MAMRSSFDKAKSETSVIAGGSNEPGILRVSITPPSHLSHLQSRGLLDPDPVAGE
jgi:hypothetical protein